jgi:hypothetical protein
MQHFGLVLSMLNKIVNGNAHCRPILRCANKVAEKLHLAIFHFRYPHVIHNNLVFDAALHSSEQPLQRRFEQNVLVVINKTPYFSTK